MNNDAYTNVSSVNNSELGWKWSHASCQRFVSDKNREMICLFIHCPTCVLQMARLYMCAKVFLMYSEDLMLSNACFVCVQL